MTRERRAALCGWAIALLWGVSFLSIKVAVREVPPMTMAAARFILACAALPLLALARRQSLAVAPRDLPRLAAGGFTGVTLYFLGENHGVALLSASESSLVIGTIPVLTVLSERVFLGRRLGGATWAGALLSFAGIGCMVAPAWGATGSVRGYLFMSVAALAWVVYNFLTGDLGSRYNRTAITFWQLLSGLVFSLPFAALEAPAWRAPSLTATLNIVYLGLFCSALGYWLYVSALDVLGPGRASVYVNLIPVVSVAAAFLLLGERLSAAQVGGGVLILAGVWLATFPGSRTIPARAG